MTKPINGLYKKIDSNREQMQKLSNRYSQYVYNISRHSVMLKDALKKQPSFQIDYERIEKIIESRVEMEGLIEARRKALLKYIAENGLNIPDDDKPDNNYEEDDNKLVNGGPISNEKITFRSSSNNDGLVKLVQPPGSFILRITEFLFNKKVYEHVYVPQVVDMQNEYFDALQEKRKYKARWILLRGHLAFLYTLVSGILPSLIKSVFDSFKAS